MIDILVTLRDEWMESAVGAQCCDFMTLKQCDMEDGSRYLRNRIEAAFLAGAEANAKARKAISDKILVHGG